MYFGKATQVYRFICAQYCSDSQGSSLHPSIKFLAIVRDSSLTKGSSQQWLREDKVVILINAHRDPHAVQ